MSRCGPSASRMSWKSMTSRLKDRSRTASKQNLKTRCSCVRRFSASHTSPNPPSPNCRVMSQPARRGISRFGAGRQPSMASSSLETERSTPGTFFGCRNGPCPRSPTSKISTGSSIPFTRYAPCASQPSAFCSGAGTSGIVFTNCRASSKTACVSSTCPPSAIDITRAARLTGAPIVPGIVFSEGSSRISPWWMPMRTRSGCAISHSSWRSSHWKRSAAPTASLGRVKRAMKPSPVCFSTIPSPTAASAS